MVRPGTRGWIVTLSLPGMSASWDVATSDDWYTPRYIFDALEVMFDLDVCAPAGGVPWIPAARSFSVGDDGLVSPWKGLVWLNPPYSDTARWLRRFVAHGNGVALVPADTSAGWWSESVADFKGNLCFLRSRVRFVRDADSTSARFPSVLIGVGCVGEDAVAYCGLGWMVRQG